RLLPRRGRPDDEAVLLEPVAVDRQRPPLADLGEGRVLQLLLAIGGNDRRRAENGRLLPQGEHGKQRRLAGAAAGGGRMLPQERLLAFGLALEVVFPVLRLGVEIVLLPLLRVFE